MKVKDIDVGMNVVANEKLPDAQVYQVEGITQHFYDDDKGWMYNLVELTYVRADGNKAIVTAISPSALYAPTDAQLENWRSTLTAPQEHKEQNVIY